MSKTEEVVMSGQQTVLVKRCRAVGHRQRWCNRRVRRGYYKVENMIVVVS